MNRTSLTISVLLSGGLIVGVCVAGFQVNEQICQLSLQGWQLKSRDGQLGLAPDGQGKWYVSAPTITNASGLFVASDPTGKEPTVHLVKDKGPHVNWAFAIANKSEPQRAGSLGGPSNGKLLVGDRSYTFTMQVAEGPFKNWYVAVDELPAEIRGDRTKWPDWRPLKLVQDPRAAGEFSYLETHFEVGHK